MRVRNKEYQSLGIKQLKELSHDFPNDAMLGEEIRRIIARATTNNPEGTSGYERQTRTKQKDNEYATKRFANQTGSRWKYYLEHEL
jgi:hypothetical protein